MYLKRKIDSFLINWKENENKKPLIVKGARQIGKTESVMHFAKKYYDNVIYINFVLEPKYKVITESGYDVDSIIKSISFIDPSKKFEEEKTIIVFDELQDYPEISTALKSFAIDGRFDVICSGSMLGINYNRIESNSVGYKTDYEMYSLDFEEYLWAKGYSENQIDDMLSHLIDLKPFSELEMNVYNELFLDYCVLGGMPAVVKSFVESGNFSGTLDIQRQLLLDYEEDIRKYAQGIEQTKLLSIYRHIPAQLAKENKKFQFSKISKSARARDYLGCVDWLIDAGVINICYCLEFPELPLKGNYDENKFKLYVADTGLLVAALDEEAQEDLRVNKNLGIYKGALYENFIAEALAKQGYDLFYYKRENASLEEDFFLRTQSNLIPVEVKASDNNSKALTTLIKGAKYGDISYGIKLAKQNIGNGNDIITFPYFVAFLLKRYLKEN